MKDSIQHFTNVFVTDVLALQEASETSVMAHCIRSWRHKVSSQYQAIFQ